ncbi:MAG TPA: putative porin [Pyrinomonadaceae bacterium]
MTRLPSRALSLCVLAAALCASAHAQTPTGAGEQAARTATPATTTADRAAGGGDAQPLDEVLRLLREQRQEIERLRAQLEEHARAVGELRARVERAEQAAPAPTRGATFAGALYTKDGDAADSAGETVAPRGAQGAQAEDRLGRVEEQVKKTSEALTKQLGSITFSGDLRMRWEPTFGQLNALPNSDDPAVLGNELSARHRFRMRARLAVRGNFGKEVFLGTYDREGKKQLGREFEWGMRLATGNFPDIISSNQTFTDFFSRKSFALDQAYVTYRPPSLTGLQLQAGKFDVPWLRTEMTIDNDLTVEGFNESYTRSFKKSALKTLTFVAWQLPFLERNSAFVVGADGRVNLEQSERGGRDLALYGAQLRARFEPTKNTALTLAAADLFYSGTQFITPAQVFGGNLQVPVTVTIPATATAPAQTVTGFATIARDQLVSGNANLGASIASNNATNRDGRLSSGFNLVDSIVRFDYTRSKRWPVMLLVNFVRNTQAHDLVLAGGPGGTNRIVPNDEDTGLWAEFQVGKDVTRLAPKDVAHGDMFFNYTFTRIEKDAVLTPFNFSDFAQQSDFRGHRFIIAYAADPRVTLSLTGLVTERPHGLLGVFGATPPGSLNRPTTRLQLDTVFRF